MLTRHKPFQGENLTVVSHRIVYDHFTPPREYARDLPPGVDRVLARALEKDPARRYQRAKEMVDDLRQIVEASATRVDPLNETQSLSSTMVLPPSSAPLVPPPPARRPPLRPPEARSWTACAAAPPRRLRPLPVSLDGTGGRRHGHRHGDRELRRERLRRWPRRCPRLRSQMPMGRPTLSRTPWRPRRRS